MQIIYKKQRTTLAILIATTFTPSINWAQSLNLAQYPAGTAYKAPIPNVIISIDTSGSMGDSDDGGKSRINYVKDGIKSTLIDSKKYDGQFRLAWQSFACNKIPSPNGNCSNNNSTAKFTGTHRANFSTWISKLTASGITPSHVLAWNAGKHLQSTGRDSPWNATPGIIDNAPLACRRAYHIFLTDGGWNFTFDNSLLSNTSFKDDMLLASNVSSLPINLPSIPVRNFDGKNISALPTPGTKTATHPGSPYGVKSYSATPTSDPSQDQTKIYRDNFGDRTAYIGSNYSRGSYYAYPTLADISFYFWATDLQPGIANEVIPKIRKTGSETFSSGNLSTTYQEYWNPKNDPAEWQHLTQYTIGYGKSASTLGKIGGASSNTYNGEACSRYSGSNKTVCENSSSSPQWTGGIFGMYSNGFTDLATGKTKWDDVTSTKADSRYDDFRPQEMWHMAINSRGKFYPVPGGDLSGVFADIFDDIVVDNAVPISGFTSASGSVSRIGTQSYQTSYVATDDASSNNDRWHGYITSDYISTSGDYSPNPAWGTHLTGKHLTTADKLDSINNINDRLILTYDKYSLAPTGVPFKWDALSDSTTGPSPRMWLNKGVVSTGTPSQIKSAIAGDNKGQNRLNFIRGERTKEARNSGGDFRNRKSRQGDIVNSAIWYTGAPANGYVDSSYKSFTSTHRGRIPMLYVGGNDGMLHGFSAKDGTEKIAYVPHGVIQNLATLADPAYSHRYYVDGSPFSGDIDIGSVTPDWRTYLVGTLGAGGRGYFVLDITKPGAETIATNPPTETATNFTENNAANLVVMDKTSAAISDAVPPSKPADPNAHDDIGHIFGNPVVAESNPQRALQITRTNNGRWALITGNGYNSANERPVLLIQYLDGDKSLTTIPAALVRSTEASGNGLSTPQFLDVNGDGIPDFAYAGDLRGNLWKFDISSHSASNWGVAFNGTPLFTATYSSKTGSSSRQPITAPPVVRTNRTVGGLMVAFGTGQNLTENDRADTSVQTIYSILDNTRYEVESTGDNKGKVKVVTSDPTPSTVGSRSNLQEESITDGNTTGTAGTGASAGRSFWKLSNTEVTYFCANASANCTTKKGWYMDLPVAGERVTTSFDFYDGSNTLEIISEKPASGSATASGEEVCAPQPQAAQPFRMLINITSGIPATPPIMDVNGDGLFTSAEDGGYARMTASSKELRFSTRDKNIRRGNDGKEDKLNKLPELMLRPNWRQLK